MRTPSGTGEREASDPPSRPPSDRPGDRPVERQSSTLADADDATLVRRIAAGDERALGALYDRWSAAVYALVLHIVRDASEAEDVVEEVFWQAWRQAARYEPERGGVSTWLLTMTRSRALDRLRSLRRRREETVPLAVASETVATPGMTPQGAAELSEIRELVAAALHELPVEQREALELAYFGGLSQTEIAARTGQPLGTVKTRMRLAMQKLRTRLATLGWAGG
jgi:RNA polymerase sigma-70 factor (ECF subfamily)